MTMWPEFHERPARRPESLPCRYCGAESVSFWWGRWSGQWLGLCECCVIPGCEHAKAEMDALLALEA